MEKKKISKIMRYIIFALLFAVSVFATHWLMPNARQFNRYFEIGKPWNYDLLTAPMDFAIYKPEAQLKMERDSLLRQIQPYFILDQSAQRELALMDYKLAEMDSAVFSFLLAELPALYSSGIVSPEQMKSLEDEEMTRVVIVDDNSIARKAEVSRLNTVGSAYAYLLRQSKFYSTIDAKQLRESNIEKLIKVNLFIDTKKNEEVRKDVINSVMPTSGMLQKGERIIDRGELVTASTYQVLSSLQRADVSEFATENSDIWNSIGEYILIILMYAFLFTYLFLFRNKLFDSFKAIIFILVSSLALLATLSAVLHFTEFSEYIVPFAMMPLIVRIFFDSRTALFMHIINVMIASIIVSDPIEFVLIQIMAGMAAVSSLKDLHSRVQLVQSAFYIFLVYVFVYTGLELSRGVKLVDLDLSFYLMFFINAISLLFAYGLIFLYEKIFGFMSGVTLVELSNISNPLMMEFSEKCPGTFQHVLQVSTLSVEVAKKLGANSLLIRTGALYHDIGKMANPMLYTENQIEGVNPLNDLPYEEAAQIIISHVSEGAKIARKAGLPQPIIDFITMHHGTSKARYFYNSFKNAYPDREIDESKFTYPGPLPQTKETAILMMTDAVEAASRSLKVYNEETIGKMVEAVVDGQIADGQLRAAPINFRDVERAKAVFKEKLINIYHNRITYPELKK